MSEVTPGAVSDCSATRLARALLLSAREDPALLRRPDAVPDDARLVPARPQPPASPRRPILLPVRPGAVADSAAHLEELVAIAVATARQAEDTLRQAGAVAASARRGRLVFAGLGAFGVMVGVVAVADLDLVHSEVDRQAQISRAANAVGNLQRQADDRLAAALSAELHAQPPAAGDATVPAQSHAAADTAPVLAQAIPVATLPTWSIASPSPPSPYDSQSGPSPYDVAPAYSRPAPRSNRRPGLRRVSAPVRPTVVLPRFVVRLRQNIQSWFR
jgi:type II secretory pathway pseudopilin PulG